MDILPISNVEYGTNYACFIDDKVYLCSCQKKSIENRIRLYELYFINCGYYDVLTGVTYDSSDIDLLKFVLGLPKRLNNSIDFSKEILPQLNFKKLICHDCNGVDADFKVILHKGSNVYRNEPYKINKAISFGIYPTGEFPPKRKKYYFVLPQSAPLTFLKNLSPSSIALDNMHFVKSKYRQPVGSRISLSEIKEFEKKYADEDVKKLLLLPFSLGKEVEYKYTWSFLIRIRRYVKSKMNRIIRCICDGGHDGLMNFENNYLENIERERFYDYTLVDGKIAMDSCLKVFIETEVKLIKKYSKMVNTLNFCQILHMSSVFYNVVKNVSLDEMLNRITFKPNLLLDESKFEKMLDMKYFLLLSMGLKIIIFNGCHSLIGINNTISEHDRNMFFKIVEDCQAHNYVSNMIYNFMQKKLPLSYYQIKEKYSDLIIRLVIYLLPNNNGTEEDIYEIDFKQSFENELNEAKIDFTSDYMWDVLSDKNQLLKKIAKSQSQKIARYN